MPEEQKPGAPAPTDPPAPAEGTYFEDPYPPEGTMDASAREPAGADTSLSPALPAVPPAPPTAPPPVEEPEEEEDDAMLRMSFLEHLEELRTRIINVLIGLAVAFFLTMWFSAQLWLLVTEPAALALKELGFRPELVQLSPMDGFMTIWVRLPLLASIFLSAPWTLWQVWSFIAPGLYKRERRFAGPFVVTTAGLFVLGGLFAYFVAFRFGLGFLLGIGKDSRVVPYISIVEYFDLFVNVTLGIGVVFELPVLVFFLIVLRIATPQFLMANSRYAVLLIVVVAAIVTPTPDPGNLMIFSIPMILLYFVGVFAGWIFTRQREGKGFPWGRILLFGALPLASAVGLTLWLLVSRYGYKLVPKFPFLLK